jgi:hypothetical protein
MQHLMRLLILALCALLSAGSAQTASISVDVRGADKPALVSIQGTLILNDDEEFRARTASLSQAVVAFESNGGNLLAGIRIGALIRTRGFATLVRAGSQCASACALAWLGGAARHMDPDAVTYVSKSGPSSMTWLTVGDAKRLGFEITRLDRGIWPSFGNSGDGASAQPIRVASAFERAEPSTPSSRISTGHRYASPRTETSSFAPLERRPVSETSSEQGTAKFCRSLPPAEARLVSRPERS